MEEKEKVFYESKEVKDLPVKHKAREKYVSPKKTKLQFQCSFCGRSENEIEKLIAGESVFICNECIDLAFKMVHGESLGTCKECYSPIILEEYL